MKIDTPQIQLTLNWLRDRHLATSVRRVASTLTNEPETSRDFKYRLHLNHNEPESLKLQRISLAAVPTPRLRLWHRQCFPNCCRAKCGKARYYDWMVVVENSLAEYNDCP